VLGIALNYGKTNANSKNATTTGTDVDTYGVNIYASHDLDRDTFLNGQIGYAYNQINSDRHNVGGPGLTANADYHSDQYSARLAVGHDYMTHQAGLIMTPSASAAYTNLRTSGYTETGTGGGLNVASETFNVLKLGVGVDANWCFKNALGARLKPVLHAGYTYNAINDRIETTASFIGGGGSFVTTGASPVRSAFDAGAGVTYMSTANWDLSANYDYIYKTDYTSHAGILRATSHF
jgi:outer membrane autotransporter protein